jgi:hypothetical protein
MLLTKVIRNFYQPSIKFPDRKNLINSGMSQASTLKLSPNMVKLTNRAALNAAMDEEI